MHVPEDVTFNLNDVTEATAGGIIDSGMADENFIGEATVSDVQNCKYIFCQITAPTLKNGSDTLNSRVKCQYMTTGVGSDPVIDFQTINNGDQQSFCVYAQGNGAGDYVAVTFNFFYSRHIGGLSKIVLTQRCLQVFLQGTFALTINSHDCKDSARYSSDDGYDDTLN